MLSFSLFYPFSEASCGLLTFRKARCSLCGKCTYVYFIWCMCVLCTCQKPKQQLKTHLHLMMWLCTHWKSKLFRYFILSYSHFHLKGLGLFILPFSPCDIYILKERTFKFVFKVIFMKWYLTASTHSKRGSNVSCLGIREEWNIQNE